MKMRKNNFSPFFSIMLSLYLSFFLKKKIIRYYAMLKREKRQKVPRQNLPDPSKLAPKKFVFINEKKKIEKMWGKK